MTWFEAEQLDLYLEKLETLLDEWRLEPIQMRIERAELNRAIHKVESVSNDDTPNPVMRKYLFDLHQRLFSCRRQIDERLKR
jgi:hypothetical protein